MSEPIKKEATGRYVVVVDVASPGEKRKQLKRRFTTYKEARTWLAATRSEVATGRYVAPTKVTVTEHLTEWLAGRRDLKPGTLANYRDAVKIVRSDQSSDRHLWRPSRRPTWTGWWPACWTAPYGSLRRRGRPGQPLGPDTIRLTLTVLTMALDGAVKEGRLARNVAALVDRPRQDKREKVVWEAAEAERFTAVSDLDRLAGAWRLSLSGLRRGEVFGLRWDSVDLEASVVHVRRSRVIAGAR